MAIDSWTKEPVLGTSKRATFAAFLHYESSSQTRNRSCCQQCDACMFWFRKVSTKKKKALTKQKNKLKMQNFGAFFLPQTAKRRVSSWRSTGISWTDRSGRQRKVRRSGKLVVCNGNILWMQSQWMAGCHDA